MALPALALQILAIANLTLERQELHDSLTKRTQWDQSYDFIVVGGGTAGAVVACRLSETNKFKVLLIEAGAQESILSDMVSMFHMQFMGAYDNWNYMTTKQTYAANKQFDMSRGKYLGGSSVVNAVGYIRGNRHIYDYWSEHYGAKGWAYDDVLPYYKKMEKQTDTNIINQFGYYHGTDGPVSVRSPMQTSLEKEWFDLLKSFGYKEVNDINSPEFVAHSVGMIQQTMIGGRRLSTSAAYLEPHKMRTNLHILTNTRAAKILFEDDNNKHRATGVEFIRNNVHYKVNANREVIVSAGAISSPQLLMLSGIGPKEHLQSKGINVIMDLPVGDNFHDGISAYFNIKSPEKDISWEKFGENMKALITVQNLHDYYYKNSGPLTTLNLHTTAFNSKYNNITDWPDGAFKSSLNLLADGMQIVHNMDVGLQILRPQSRGTIRLNTTNPFDSPIIDPSFYSNPIDMKVMSETFRELFRVANSSAKFIKLTQFDTKCEKCTPNANDNCDQFYECLAKEYVGPTGHMAGSCRMGAGSDSNAVLDERLKVRGVHGLRVIDASVMPQNVEPGTYTATIMIGEKGSDFILKDNN